MKIACDVDDVLCDFVGSYVTAHNQKHGTDFTKEDMKSWSLPKHLYISETDFKEDLIAKCKSGFLLTLPEIPFARQGFNDLKRNHLMIVATARHPANKEDTSRWLQEHKMTPNGLYLSKDKKPIYGHADIAIDDSEHNIYEAASLGVYSLLFDQPWNRNVQESSRIKRVYTWSDILNEVDKYERETQKASGREDSLYRS